jgi:hypothetical protein
MTALANPRNRAEFPSGAASPLSAAQHTSEPSSGYTPS